MAAIPRCTIRNRGVQTHIFWCLCPHHCVRHPHHCLAKFQDLALKISMTKLIFQDFAGRSWTFYKHNSRTFQEAWEPRYSFRHPHNCKSTRSRQQSGWECLHPSSHIHTDRQTIRIHNAFSHICWIDSGMTN